MTLKYFNFSSRYSMLELGLSGLNQDDGRKTKDDVVVYWRFFDLSNKLSQGNYNLYNISKTSDSIALFNSCNAILSYQACYDYFLQIVFFGFGFYNDFSTSEEYKRLIKKCRLNPNNIIAINPKYNENGRTKDFEKRINDFCCRNSDFMNFFREFYYRYKFLNDETFGIGNWANCIKHQGGFLTQEFYDSQHSNNLLFYSNNSEVCFSTAELYAYKPSIDEIIKRLKKQNEQIVSISDWLFECFYPTRKIESFQEHPLPQNTIFTNDGTEQNK